MCKEQASACQCEVGGACSSIGRFVLTERRWRRCFSPAIRVGKNDVTWANIMLDMPGPAVSFAVAVQLGNIDMIAFCVRPHMLQVPLQQNTEDKTQNKEQKTPERQLKNACLSPRTPHVTT